MIPARGGSKGVLRKNVRFICGRPLISYTIETALKVQHLLYRVIVSSEDEEIATIARQYGADVPFLRPPELSGDNVPTLPVLKHAAEFIEKRDGVTLDWILLLQPTDPFRSEEDIRAALDLAQEGGCDSVISVVQVFSVHPILMKRVEDNRLLPYCIGLPATSLYAQRRDLFNTAKSFNGEKFDLGRSHPSLRDASGAVNWSRQRTRFKIG